MFLTTLFVFLSIIYILCSVMVIFSRNPIQSVLFLILVFIVTICFFFLLGAEFLSLVFLIIYVGAIAVLFLFVVMMLNIKTLELNESFLKYLPISLFIILIFLLEINYILDVNLFYNLALDFQPVYSMIFWDNYVENVNTIELVGKTLYTYFCLFFFLSSFILLLAMIGSICLTLNYIKVVRREDVFKQVSQDLKQSIKLYDLENV